MTPREFYYAIKYVITEEESKHKIESSLQRLNTFLIINALGANINSPEDLYKFYWENDEEVNTIDIKEPDWAKLEKELFKK